MQVVSVQLDGFAGLEGRREFSPGLNVIVGPNEAGKSRLIAALHYGLCGRVKKRGRGVDPAERYRPWTSTSAGFRLALTLKLDNGHTLEVSQNLDEPGRSRVVDVDLGRDLTTELLSDRAPDASRLLGLNRDVVAKTLLVTQGDLLAVRDGADAMQSLLQRAATSGALDETANSALARLEAFKADRIGTEHASSKRPLRLSRDHEANTRRALDELRALHTSLSQERAALVKQRGELVRLEVARHQAKARELEEELTRLERLHVRLDALDAELARLDAVIATEGPELEVEVLRRLEREIDSLVGAGPPRPPATSRPESIEAELAGLPLPPEGDREPQPALDRLERSRQLARAAHERHQQEAVAMVAPPTGLEPHALRECARELEVPAPAQAEPVSADDPRGPRLLAASALTVGLLGLGLGVGLQSALTLFLGLVLVALGVATALIARKRQRAGLAREASRRAAEADLTVHRERRTKLESTLARHGLAGADSAALEAAASRYEDALDRSRARRIWEEQLAAHTALVSGFEAQLSSALAAVGAASWSAYVEACRERQRLEVESRRRVDLQRLLATSEREHAAFTAAAGAREACLTDVERWAAELGVAVSLPRDGVIAKASLEPLAVRLGELLARDDARRRRHELSEERGTLLGAEDKSALTARLGALKRKVVEVGPNACQSGPTSLDLDVRITDLQREVARREATLTERLRGFPSIAELEERLDLAQREHARLRRLDRLVVATIEQLMLARDTIHRDIAPRLSAALTAVIPRLTGGRWERARIAVDDLAVTVLREHEWRPAHDLSCGTAEQVYLALRVVLATTLARAGESAPLILDDVLVHADADRKDELLGWLVELAESHQVILTTHDLLLVDWARANGGRVHELA